MFFSCLIVIFLGLSGALSIDISANSAIHKSLTHNLHANEQRVDPSIYFKEIINRTDYADISYEDRACQSWRLDTWTATPPHEASDFEKRTFLIGVGPPRTASSSTFSTYASNPHVCYWRERESNRFEETHYLVEKGSATSMKSFLNEHVAPAACCKVTVMKQPRFAYHQVDALKLHELFGNNENAKLLLTIRDPVDAMVSLVNLRAKFSSSDEALEKILKETDKFKECLGDLKQAYVDFTKEAGMGYVDQCLKMYSLQYYDYETTYNRYADLFGKDRIMCQFFSDVKEGKQPENRREQLNFLGASGIDADDFISKRTLHDTSDYAIVFTDEQKTTLRAKYDESFGPYDEAKLRQLCKLEEVEEVV